MLDAIASVVGHGQAGSKLVGALAKQGYLQNFVNSVKESEGELLDTLVPDPESLNALYAYEAKMSFLTRVASTPDGAERLLDLKLLPKLADCGFLSAKPKATDSTMGKIVCIVVLTGHLGLMFSSADFDAFLPPVVQRYHQLLVPALQVSLAIASSSGARNSLAARQVLLSGNSASRTPLIHCRLSA
jgi:nuclear pore complex protein Nup205